MSLPEDPLQQPIRKRVGRALTAADRLAQLEDMQKFIMQVMGPDALKAMRADSFPPRKIVGRGFTKENTIIQKEQSSQP